MTTMRPILLLLLASVQFTLCARDVTQYVDPRIGSEGLGRVFIGPATPYGMVRPSPDCTAANNSGWAPMPVRVDGFAQTHVSGTGGGPKYGNILVTPFTGQPEGTAHYDYRTDEVMQLGYYSTTFRDSGIKTEITTAPRASLYRFVYPADSARCLAVDCGFFLGESPVPDAREAQQFVGSEIRIVSDTEISGYSRIRGGWNNGRAYTVYFHAVSDTPFSVTRTWKGDNESDATSQYDSGEKTGALVRFADGTDTVHLKVGISFVSELKARHNANTEIEGHDFEGTLRGCRRQWNDLLSRVEVPDSTPLKLKRMLYTGLYHTMLMPSDRTGENPLWTDPGEPYYDDFYAIWDTYRTSTPLITLLDPGRAADIARSLVNIGHRDGYMPDARSGNANGRTQGGPNAAIVIADAMAKGLEGIDYEAALQLMVKDAEVPPGGNEEAEGRGGLREYNELGYVPHGIPRAGNRTVEYSFCDWAIAQVADRLGRTDVRDKYLARSGNWRNLWNPDCRHAGHNGFIMPRMADGSWPDSITYGVPGVIADSYRYTPMTFEGPWYTPWWSMFFYEAPSWEYSFSIPHDVEGLIARCGGEAEFERRLDTFFDRGFYNVNNEPSFLTPCLYHWVGRPDKSSDRVAAIIGSDFDDTPGGLPGNDDSGAMSSWLVFHMLGLYPNAGHDWYLIHTPLLGHAVLHPGGGRTFTITAPGLSHANRYIQTVTLNGKPLEGWGIGHADIIKGGELKLTMGPQPMGEITHADADTQASEPFIKPGEGELAVYRLHGQTRRYRMRFTPQPDGGIGLDWGIERNGHWQSGRFEMSPLAVERGTAMSFLMPVDGETAAIPDHMTWGILSRAALKQLREEGKMCCNGLDFEVTRRDGNLIHTVNTLTGMEMAVRDDLQLPRVVRVTGNPLGQNWEVQ